MSRSVLCREFLNLIILMYMTESFLNGFKISVILDQLILVLIFRFGVIGLKIGRKV